MPQSQMTRRGFVNFLLGCTMCILVTQAMCSSYTIDAVTKSIENLIDRTNEAQAQASAIPTDKYVQDCQKVYNDAVVNLKNAIGFLQGMDLRNVNNYVSAAIADFNICDNAYTYDNLTSPFASTNIALTHMAGSIIAHSEKVKA